MAADKYDSLGAVFNDIGDEVVLVVNGDITDAYVYAEADDGSVCAAIFNDEGEIIRYHDPSRRLFDLIARAWEMENNDPTKRWAVMEYVLEGGQFDVDFLYHDDLKEDEFLSDRRKRALKERYGNKRIIYPPMPEGASEPHPNEEQP